jgi:hypothetical protein
MLKKIWQSLVRGFRKLFGLDRNRKVRQITTAELPSLDDADYEYLFMQLLEGVAHGWQQPRAVGFFSKIRHRIRKSDWLDWLDRFGQNLLNAPVPNYELAGRMVQLSQLDCGEIGDKAGEYGFRLLERQQAEMPMEFMPIMEFEQREGELLEIGDNGVDDSHGEDTGYLLANTPFGEVPPELLIDKPTIPPPPPPPYKKPGTLAETHPSATDNSQVREITLEEFAMMLHQDPSLVADLSQQLGLETSNPEDVLNAVISQMQQQVQPISGDLTQSEQAIASPLEVKEEITAPPPTISAPPKPLEDPWTIPAESGE